MKWINKPHPKKGKFIGILKSRKAILKWSLGNHHSIAFWMGDRWTTHHTSGANKVIGYMWLD